jgi:uncharacterized protein YjbI with pentapeptide repeats
MADTTSLSIETVTDATEVCQCREEFRTACVPPALYKHEDRNYCVLHLPARKGEAFKQAVNEKIKKNDFNFQAVWFPDDIRFVEIVTKADFSHATFNAGASFIDVEFKKRANFFRATFNTAAYFNNAIFDDGVNLKQATFNAGVNFSGATFKNVDCSFSNFRGAVDFKQASFRGAADFSGATFRDHLVFAGRQQQFRFSDLSTLNLQFARIEKPDCVSFHTLTLRPHCFVNVDARKFEFTNVEWSLWSGHNIDDEITSLEALSVSSPHRLLAITCRHLAVNAEENHRYEEASKFRYMAMDARRLEKWQGLDFRKLSWWYWLASGYGERIMRAAVVLLGILCVSAMFYMKVGFARWEAKRTSETETVAAKRDEVGEPFTSFSRALTYSAAVMTFQRPEPRAATTAAQTVVLLETILGPVQAALLALAIRRKFMR